MVHLAELSHAAVHTNVRANLFSQGQVAWLRGLNSPLKWMTRSPKCNLQNILI